MPGKFASVEEYISSLPSDRQEAILAVREVMLKNLPKGIEEGIQYGMIGYFVPHSIYPDGYHCNPAEPLPFAHLASQKNHMAVYLMCIYGDEKHVQFFQDEWAKTGKRLDMGKSCVRFKKLEDVALNVIGKSLKKIKLREFIDHYETVVKSSGKRITKKSAASKKSKKAASRKSATGKPSATKNDTKKSAPTKLSKRSVKAASKKTSKPKVKASPKKKSTVARSGTKQSNAKKAKPRISSAQKVAKKKSSKKAKAASTRKN